MDDHQVKDIAARLLQTELQGPPVADLIAAIVPPSQSDDLCSIGVHVLRGRQSVSGALCHVSGEALARCPGNAN
ncbi:hypothetical protein [Rhizobium sp. BK251]|uniref:hypothetical protein n=1 Tax=Rhizobium sp. BK251 TaxID=2512125 RepID=UPI00104F87D3|nr:hypothetical protein [Rhizobium sp. BK251]TCL73823.1 hypothetical protein EV286_103357 [Rhizobium sp. BK251]